MDQERDKPEYIEVADRSSSKKPDDDDFDTIVPKNISIVSGGDNRGRAATYKVRKEDLELNEDVGAGSKHQTVDVQEDYRFGDQDGAHDALSFGA